MRLVYLTLFMCTMLCMHDTIESTKDAIASILAQKNPTVLTEFAIFFHTYDERVRTFFDRADNHSLRVHIVQMECELEILRRACGDTRFKAVQNILCEHYAQVADLIRILKQHIDSRDTLGLAFKVRKFKKLLPYDVAKKGDLELFWALHHRLRC